MTYLQHALYRLAREVSLKRRIALVKHLAARG